MLLVEYRVILPRDFRELFFLYKLIRNKNRPWRLCLLTYLVRASCIFCAHELLSCAHKLLSCAHHELLSCAHKLLSCGPWFLKQQLARSLPTRIFWYLDFGPRFLKPQVFTHPNNLAWVTHGQGLYVGKSFSVGNGHISPKSGGGGGTSISDLDFSNHKSLHTQIFGMSYQLVTHAKLPGRVNPCDLRNRGPKSMYHLHTPSKFGAKFPFLYGKAFAHILWVL